MAAVGYPTIGGSVKLTIWQRTGGRATTVAVALTEEAAWIAAVLWDFGPSSAMTDGNASDPNSNG